MQNQVLLLSVELEGLSENVLSNGSQHWLHIQSHLGSLK